MFNITLRLISTGALLLGLALIVRLLAGPDIAMGLIIVITLFMVGHHTHSAAKLRAWMDDLTLENAPSLGSWWGELASRLYKNLKTYQRQQQMLANSLLGFRNAAHALPDGVITINTHLQINWCNETAESHFGLKSTRDMGQVVTNLVRDPDFVAFVRARAEDRSGLMRSPRDPKVLLSLQMVNYGEDEMLILSRDVTEREKLDRIRRDFVANVSHELKTPLTVLLGFLETVQDLDLTETEKARYLSLMSEQGRRMQTLIDDLLTLSSLESKVSNLPDETIDAHKLIARIEADAKVLSAGRHAINFDISPGLVLRGRENEIHSAFANLVSNAIRYTPEGGRIQVRWYRDEQGDGHFDVQDSGIGIPAEHIPRLSERFYRVDRSRSRETGGTGLGLAIVKHVMTRHQGRLEIVSEVGKGSRFSAILPKARVD